MLSDAQWSELEPLVAACRPKIKTPSQDPQRSSRRSSGGIGTGPRGRAILEDRDPWWRAAQIFIRWVRAGVRERLLSLVQERGPCDSA